MRENFTTAAAIHLAHQPLPDADLDLISAYTKHSYFYNDALWYVHLDMIGDSVRGLVYNEDAYLDALELKDGFCVAQSDFIVYSGVKWNPCDKIYSPDEPDTDVFATFRSATTSFGIAHTFSRPCAIDDDFRVELLGISHADFKEFNDSHLIYPVLDIKMKQAKTKVMSVRHLSHHRNEDELIIGFGTKYEIHPVPTVMMHCGICVSVWRCDAL